MKHNRSETIRILKKHVTLNPDMEDDWILLFKKIQGAIYTDALRMIKEGRTKTFGSEKIKAIHDIVARHFDEIYHKGVTDLRIRSRRREVSEPRFFFFYFVCKHVDAELLQDPVRYKQLTLDRVGYLTNPDYPFDHATVWNGINQTERIITTNRQMRQVFDKIKKEVEAL